MASGEIQARHVFHAATSGWDRIHAWREATGEPVFVWGTGSGAEDGVWFGGIKRAFRRWIGKSGSGCGLTVYHDGVGADAFGPLDTAGHKAIFLHTFFPRWERHFEWLLRSTGLVLVGDEALPGHLRERFGWIPERYIHALAQPLLSGQEDLVPRPEGARERTGIWLQGKSWRRFGNRLRSVVDRWPRDEGELEIITGAGKAPRWARRDGVIWTADMPFEFAQHRLFTWDSVLLLNDYALDAPWLLRALAIGCFPLVPDGESPQRRGIWEADAAPRPYAWGDIGAAGDRLREWRAGKEGLFPRFQGWAGNLLARHPESPAFSRAWASAKAGLLEQRPPRLGRRKPHPDWYPVRWYERVQRLREGV